MSLTAGSRLGPYEVVALIDTGGMGEVYRARDTTLGRDVAIKVLPPSVSTDPARLARFDREARALAALNHANIATIYGVEQSGETRALVLELVDGPTLADRILEGPLPIAEAVRIARQIAAALEAAHEQGIVHRDLKPANIKLRRDGTVKVLDFGLAKLVEPATGSDAREVISQSPTITSPEVLTHVGVILGTAAYMSPEQAKGQQADKRSDIWAFGCVLFEMLTGRRAFESPSVTETLAFVMTKEPDWSALPADLSSANRTLLIRCLERDRHTRIGNISTVRFVLEEFETLTDPMRGTRPAITPAGGMRRRAVWMTSLAAVIAVLAVAVYRYLPQAPERAFTFSILPPEGTSFASVTQGGAPALSPDGRQIAFVAVAEGPAKRRLLWVQSIDALDARPLTGTEGALAPYWSPDGAWLGFVAEQSLKKVSVAGGQPQAITRGNGSVLGAFSGTWNRDDTILFSIGRDNTLASISASGEIVQATERNIALFDENHLAPMFLPDGRHYLLLVRGGRDLQQQVWVGELGSNERRLLVNDVTNAKYAPPHAGAPGYLLYVRERKLMAHRFDADSLSLVGSAVPVADGVAVTGSESLGDFTVSSNGVLAYRRAEPVRQELAWFDRQGTQTGTLGDRAGNVRSSVRVSPDGKWAAFTRMGDAVQDVWIADLIRGGATRFTFDGGRSPVWSPDGAQLAFLRQDTVYRKRFRGQGSEVAIWSGPGTLSLNDWSGDGMYLALTRWDTSKPGITGRGLWLLPAPLVDTASHEPMPVEPGALHSQFGPKIGPPRWIAFDKFDGTDRQVFVRTMPGSAPGRWQVTIDGGNTSRWRADGRELYVLSRGTTLLVADVDASASFHASLRPLFPAAAPLATASSQYAPGWDVTPDGQRFLTTLPVPDTPARAIVVTTNWQSLLHTSK